MLRAPNCAHCTEYYPNNPSLGIHRCPATNDLVCRSCFNDAADWMNDQEAPTDGFDGPHFADTMSGGCIQL